MFKGPLLSLVAICSVSACDELPFAASKPEQLPLPVWTVSGSCSETYQCVASVPRDRTNTSCPESAHMWCREGAACNPNDTTPCVGLSDSYDDEAARACQGENARFAFFTYRVLTCAPTGVWRPAERNTPASLASPN